MFSASCPLLKYVHTLCILFVAWFFSVTSQSFSQPGIKIAEGASIDLGTLYEGRTTVRELTVQNIGRDTLVIGNVRTSCGCAVAKLSSHRIAPGGGEKLTVTFESKDIQGKIKREVYITSNDSAHPKMDIIFTGTIVSVVQVTPRYVSLGQQKLHYSARYTVQLRSTVTDTIRILSYTSPDPQLHLYLAENVIPPNGTVTMEVDLSPTTKGKLLGQLELTTDSRLKPVIKISYIGLVR